jgi:hypothetical protein
MLFPLPLSHRIPRGVACFGTIPFTVLSCSPFQAAGAKIRRSALKLLNMASSGQGRRHDHETTVDHALMRGLVAA